MALSNPEIQEKLEAIEKDLEIRQPEYAEAAAEHFDAIRERKHQRAAKFLEATGSTVAEREARADEFAALVGINEEAKYMGMKAAIETMAERARILQSLLKVP